MCEQHQALEVEKRIVVRYPKAIRGPSLALPALPAATKAAVPAINEETAGRAAAAIEPVSTGVAAVKVEDDTASAQLMITQTQEAARQAGERVDAPTTRGETRRRVKKQRPLDEQEYTYSEPEDPRKAELVALVRQLQLTHLGQKLSGKKQLQAEYTVVEQLAGFLGIQLPFNSDRNFEKSEGFRRNLAARVRAEAEKLLGEEADSALPDFMKA